MQIKTAEFITTSGNFQLKEVDFKEPDLKAGQVLIKQSLVSLDEYAYQEKKALAGLGEVLMTGSGITWLKKGDKICYFNNPHSFTNYRVVSHETLLKIPDFLSQEESLGLFIRGFIAHMLTVRTIIVRQGMRLIIDNIDSPTGAIIGWFAKERGASFIVGINYSYSNTAISGVDLILDAKDPQLENKLFESSQDGYHIYFSGGVNNIDFSLIAKNIIPIGVIVDSFGTITNLDLLLLGEKSLFYTRPQLIHYKSIRSEMVLTMEDLKERFQIYKPLVEYTILPLEEINIAFTDFPNKNKILLISI
jgi:NADPH:quinone reductase-like Zn-dependent oxidoreductase